MYIAKGSYMKYEKRKDELSKKGSKEDQNIKLLLAMCKAQDKEV